MGEKKKKMVNTNLGILLICLFSSIFTMADFIIIDHVLDKYFDYSKCECTKCGDSNLNLGGNTDNTPVVEDEKDENNNINIMDNYDYFREISCIEKRDKYCLYENKDNLKVEIEADSKLNYTVIINGNRFFPNFDYMSYLKDIQILSDDYIFVEYGEQGIGPVDKAFILDSNGTVITDTSNLDYVLGDYDRNNIEFSENILRLSNRTYGDGGIKLACYNKKENRNTWPEYDEIVFVTYSFEYIGNGKLNETNMNKKTFSELLKEQTGYSTCEELLNR